jgi:hypothetical protein
MKSHIINHKFIKIFDPNDCKAKDLKQSVIAVEQKVKGSGAKRSYSSHNKMTA